MANLLSLLLLQEEILVEEVALLKEAHSLMDTMENLEDTGLIITYSKALDDLMAKAEEKNEVAKKLDKEIVKTRKRMTKIKEVNKLTV